MHNGSVTFSTPNGWEAQTTTHSTENDILIRKTPVPRL